MLNMKLLCYVNSVFESVLIFGGLFVFLIIERIKYKKEIYVVWCRMIRVNNLVIYSLV